MSIQLNINSEVTQSKELIIVNPLSSENAQSGQIIITVNPIHDLNSGHMFALGTPETDF